jgi:metallo-beta-lactamase family protein
MQIEFSGAAREVTGSCHIIRAAGKTVLLDCGLFQGRRAESRVKNQRLPVDIEHIDAVVLSHAHIDHAGRLPFLINRGYRGTIWATAATRDLCAVMLADSAHIQEKDAEFLERRGKEHAEPLYTMEDAVSTQNQMIGVPYHKWFDVCPGFRAYYTDAGHILGSASVILEVKENGTTKRLIFSGDVGRAGLPIIRDPEPPTGGADAIIMESTYGNRDHESVEGAREHLGKVVSQTAARGGRVIIPSFAVGRTQELVYDLHVLHQNGAIPEIPIVIDSPLALNATTVFRMHPEVFDRGEDLVRKTAHLFDFPLVRFTQDVEESKALNRAHGPMIIISASGMAESGRILHHLKYGLPDPRNTVLIVGFQAEHTLGRRLVEKRNVVKVFGEEVDRAASVEILNGYSAHGDRSELKEWLDAVRDGGRSSQLDRPRVHLVHGEAEAQDAFVKQLSAAGYTVDAPEPGETRPV